MKLFTLCLLFALPAAANPRLVDHFDTVLDELAEQTAPSTSPAAHLRRAWLAGVLADYRDGGRFPINLDFAAPTPYFVDAAGTRCAMAHLIEATEEFELVADVAATRNNAYLPQLADDVRLQDWLRANGLTVAEAARIQPQYQRCYRPVLGHCRDHEFAPVWGRVSFERSGPEFELTVAELYSEAAFVAVGDLALLHDYDLAPQQASGALIGWFQEGEDTPEFTARHEVFPDGAHLLIPFEWDELVREQGGDVVPVDVLVEALASEDCEATLGEAMPELLDERCQGDHPPDAEVVPDLGVDAELAPDLGPDAASEPDLALEPDLGAPDIAREPDVASDGSLAVPDGPPDVTLADPDLGRAPDGAPERKLDAETSGCTSVPSGTGLLLLLPLFLRRRRAWPRVVGG